MAIPSRQIGWGTEENLLWEISKQLEMLANVAGNLSITNIPNIPVYANNDDAIAGGLIVGDLYRTGDFLKIVH